LLLLRLALTGFVGGLLGVAVCMLFLFAAPAFLNESLQIGQTLVQPSAGLVLLTIVFAPFVSLLAGYLPVLLALKREPAAALME